jgi:hypothetical protein
MQAWRERHARFSTRFEVCRARSTRYSAGRPHNARRSLNQVILDELAAVTGGRKPKADFSDLVGRWTPDPAFDEIIASQRKIDLEKWK